ncbi:MAG: DUF4065 domain-containing protein [Chloroflexi bacterium]|nr:DUF4065 domain-containing protein [Chloroflexota bacterium]
MLDHASNAEAPVANPAAFNRRKFRELLIHVAAESEDDIRFGVTKLNTILYCSDLKAFAILGCAITGATYRKRDRGPVPEELPAVLREMEAEGEIERVEQRDLNLLLKRVVPLRAPDLSVFSARELEIVDRVILEMSTLDAAQSRLLSHLIVSWRIAGYDEVIPYHSAYISDRRPTHRELVERGLAPAPW